MKYILFFLISLNTYCFSQDRINDALPIISNANGALQTSTGWLKNGSGEWISGKNKIPDDLGANQKLLDNYEIHILGQDNFLAFEQRNITIDGNEFILLLKKYKDGFYKYESIQKGWSLQNSYKFYILDKAEFSRIETVEHNVLNKLKLDLVYYGEVKYIDLKTLTKEKIAKEIKKQIQDDPILKYKLALNIACYDSKKVVQFYFFDYVSEYLVESDEKYYESSYETFNQFINIE